MPYVCTASMSFYIVLVCPLTPSSAAQAP